MRRNSSRFEADSHCRLLVGMCCCKPSVLVRCSRCCGRYTTEGMGKRAATYYRAAVRVVLRRIGSKMMLSVIVDLPLSWLSMYASS
jgi:hypothetical protein